MEQFTIDFFRLFFESLKVLIIAILLFSAKHRKKTGLLASFIITFAVISIGAYFYSSIIDVIVPGIVFLLFADVSYAVWKWLFSYILVQSFDNLGILCIRFFVGYEIRKPDSLSACVLINLAETVIIVISLLGVYIATKKYRKSPIVESPKRIVFLIPFGIIVFAIVAGARIIISNDIEKIDFRIRFFYTITIIFLTLLIILIYFTQFFLYDFGKYYEKAANLEKTIRDNEKKYFDEQHENYRELAKFKHNLSFQIDAIYACIRKNENLKAAEMLETIGDIVGYNDMPDTGNKVLDVLLMKYKRKSDVAGIAFNIQGHIYGELLISELDFSVVVGNLLKNAYEECERIGNDAWIRVLLKNHERYCILTFDNITQKDKVNIETIKSEKKEKEVHGLGIKSIKDIMSGYPEAEIRQTCNTNVFSTTIWIPQKCE